MLALYYERKTPSVIIFLRARSQPREGAIALVPIGDCPHITTSHLSQHSRSSLLLHHTFASSPHPSYQSTHAFALTHNHRETNPPRRRPLATQSATHLVVSSTLAGPSLWPLSSAHVFLLRFPASLFSFAN